MADIMTLHSQIKKLMPDRLSLDSTEFLESAVKQRLNIMIAGACGAGKTALLNCLESAIDPSLSIIAIEDFKELQFEHPDEMTRNLVVKDINDNLHRSPDNIIIVETKGEEAFDLLQAMVGHDGCLATIAANSAQHLLNTRLPDMIRAACADISDQEINMLIADSLDLVICLILDKEGQRRIAHIAEVYAVPENNQVGCNRLWNYDDTQKKLCWVSS